MKLVAVTSCPTGIAHSQMAAENLEQTAEELGHDISVEVQGAIGAENELSEADIDAGDAAIIASDTSISQDRFKGAPLIDGTVKDAVNDGEGMIADAVDSADGDAPTAETEGDSSENTGGADQQRHSRASSRG